MEFIMKEQTTKFFDAVFNGMKAKADQRYKLIESQKNRLKDKRVDIKALDQAWKGIYAPNEIIAK